MKRKLTLLMFAICSSVYANLVFDGFDDGVIDSNIWTTFSRAGGQVIESSGSLNYILGTDSGAGIRLNDPISSDSDFRVNADIRFEYTSLSEITIFGIVIYEVNLQGDREPGAAFTTRHDTNIGISDYDPYTFVSGQAIGSSSFSFQIDYSQADESFIFSSLTDTGISDTLTFSIRNDPGYDLSTDWGLQASSRFGIEIVAEAFSDPVSEGLIGLESFEILAIPEPGSFPLYLGLTAILCLSIKRKA